MALTVTALGLCAECEHHPGCTLASHHPKPVTNCEEFCCAGESAMNPDIGEDSPEAIPEVQDNSGTSELIGLCSDCELSETCQFPRPLGGVWHCEEYR